jgi:FlaA1/EpsC-like NDP-sugar epimerase
MSPQGTWHLAPEGEPIIIFGAGYGGTHVSESLRRDPNGPFRVVALLDDDPMVHGRRIAGVLVEGGQDRLVETAQQ